MRISPNKADPINQKEAGKGTDEIGATKISSSA
jgi:hypothetical protein